MFTITLTPTGTTFISETAGTTNFSTFNTIFVGQNTGITDNFRGIIRFDLSSIPIGFTITSATLRLFINFNIAPATIKVINLDNILQNYNINTVTWNTQPQIDLTPVSSTTITNQINVPINFDVTNIAESWHTGSIPNLGLMMVGDETKQSLVGFNSANWPFTNGLPMLILTLEPGILNQSAVQTVITADTLAGSTPIFLGVNRATFGVVNTGGINSAQAIVQLSPDGVTWINDIPAFETIPILAPGDSLIFTTKGNMNFARIAYASAQIGAPTTLNIYAAVAEKI